MGSKKQRKQKQEARRHSTQPHNKVSRTLLHNDLTQEGQSLEAGNGFNLKRLLPKRQQLEKQIFKDRNQLLEILKMAGPADLVAQASLIYLRFDPNIYRESEDDRSLGHIEYLALQALAVGLDSPPIVEPIEAYNLTFEALELVRSLFDNTALLNILDTAKEAKNLEVPLADYQLSERLRSLSVRGTGYTEHLERVITGCFEPFDEICNQLFGFTFENALAIFKATTKLVEDRVNKRITELPNSYSDILHRLKHERRSKSSQTLPNYLLAMPPNIAKQYLKQSVLRWVFLNARSLAVLSSEEISNVTNFGEEVIWSFMNEFSCDLTDFNAEYHALPSGAHPLTTKPVLKVGNEYMIPVPHTMLDAIRPRMETLLKTYDNFWEEYSRHRAKFVEKEGTKLLSSAFPGSSFWINLEWQSDEDKSDLDGLIEYGDMAVRIQCKAGQIAESTRRGSQDRMVKNLRKLIKEPADQHFRLTSALEKYSPASLGFSDQVAHALAQPLKFEVIITLDEIATWATQAHKLQDIDILSKDRSIPWILSLTDLMVVVDLLKGASLVHYMIRRQRLEQDGRIRTSDELDWVGHYIYNGLLFDSYFSREDEISELWLSSHTDPIDAWYFTKEGIREENPVLKPKQKIPSPLSELLNRLEIEKPLNWLIASITLLDFDEQARAQIANGVKHVWSKAASKGQSNATYGINNKISLTFYVNYRADLVEVKQIVRKKIRTKMLTHKTTNWVVIGEASDAILFVIIVAENGISGLLEHFMSSPNSYPE